jgi:single-strand selective monofunctional uracil DNA glycosylase
MTLAQVTDRLVRDLGPLRFGAPVTHVYNPLIYARAAWDAYVERYAHPGVEVVLLGMNPGPWGMVQTGVPFGDPSMVRDWLGITTDILKPAVEHPKRPIQGLACPRREVSGTRLWGWARERFGTPAKFFRRFFVANYCPLAFLEASGRNYTPDHLPPIERAALNAACDRALYRTVELLQPRMVVGVGVFAEDRARAALAGLAVAFGRMPHPSPASPAANLGWAKLATASLEALGVSCRA